MTEMDPKIARNWRSERLRKYMEFLVSGFRSRLKAGCSQDWLPHKTLASGDSFHADQLAEDDAFQSRCGGEARVAAAAAQGHGLDGVAVFVEGLGVAAAGVVVEIELEPGAGFG